MDLNTMVWTIQNSPHQARMNFSDFLVPGAVALDAPILSAKKTLEKISWLLCHSLPQLDSRLVFNHLQAREKLGSTALVQAVAIPHCRLPYIDTPITAVLRTRSAIDFGSVHGEKTRLFMALAVPEEAAQAHLEILAKLVEQLQDESLIQSLLKIDEIDTFTKQLKKQFHRFAL